MRLIRPLSCWMYLARRRLATAFGILVLTLASALPVGAQSTPESATLIDRLGSFTDRAAQVAIEALSLVGIRYRYGGNSPEQGLDCSGLVRYVFREVDGTELPRTSGEMSRHGQPVDKQDLQPGDLVFFNTLNRAFSHVGIYLGNNQFIHAPSAGRSVRVENMDMTYWKTRFNGARRVLDSEAAPR
jgi:cell wall-associated NlpC family hydrolase